MGGSSALSWSGMTGIGGGLIIWGLDPEHRKKGIGRALMGEAERVLAAVGCPKINLQVVSTNQSVIAFYRAIGFAVDEVISMGKRLEKD